MTDQPDQTEPTGELEILHRQVEDLQRDLANTKADLDRHADLRRVAEESRDGWITIARTLGVVPGRTNQYFDRDALREAAAADAYRADRRREYAEGEVRQRDQLLGGLLMHIYRIRRLPVAVKQLHYDELAALVWAYSRQGKEWVPVVCEQGLPDSVRTELRDRYRRLLDQAGLIQDVQALDEEAASDA